MHSLFQTNGLASDFRIKTTMLQINEMHKVYSWPIHTQCVGWSVGYRWPYMLTF